jgi:hypothetical protein
MKLCTFVVALHDVTGSAQGRQENIGATAQARMLPAARYTHTGQSGYGEGAAGIACGCNRTELDAAAVVTTAATAATTDKGEQKQRPDKAQETRIHEKCLL